MMGNLETDIALVRFARAHPEFRDELAHSLRERWLRPEWPMPFGSPDPLGEFRRVAHAETADRLPYMDGDREIHAIWDGSSLSISRLLDREPDCSTFEISASNLLFQKRAGEWWWAPTSPPETAPATTTSATGPE